MIVGQVVEGTDRWWLGIGGTVTQCRVDHAYTIVIAHEGLSFEVRIEQPFVVSYADRQFRLDAEGDPVSLAPGLRMLHRTVLDAIAFKDGRLEMTFDDGGVIRVAAGQDFESWNVVGSNGIRIVSLPGGDLAVWTPPD